MSSGKDWVDEALEGEPLGHDFGRTPFGLDQVRARHLSEPLNLRDALRALQALDEREQLGVEERLEVMRALDALGHLLGLECTGVAEGGGWYSHNGDTCPIHEWLDERDSISYAA